MESVFEVMKGDQRVGPVHVALYFSIVSMGMDGDREEWMRVERLELMARARIGSKHTYYRVMRELAEIGLIDYRVVRFRGRSMVRVRR
jgi:hypothetical protein